MNLFKNIKKVFSKEKKERTQEIIDFILDKIEHAKQPDGVKNEDWVSHKKEMLFAFRVKKRKLQLVSRRKKQAQDSRVKRGFKLFERYIKNL